MGHLSDLGKNEAQYRGKVQHLFTINWRQLFSSRPFSPQNEGNYPENADPLHIALHIACWQKIISLLGMALAVVPWCAPLLNALHRVILMAHLEHNTTLTETLEFYRIFFGHSFSIGRVFDTRISESGDLPPLVWE